MEEKFEILKARWKEPDKLINAKSEFFGACRHNTKFHRYTMNGSTSTDEGSNPEKALGDISNITGKDIAPPPGEAKICMVCTATV